MNIKFYTLKFKAKDGEHTRASRRFRAIIPLKGMRKNDGQIEELDKATRDDIIILAKSLGFFTSVSIKKAYAANTELKIVRDYYRIFIYINQVNLEIPILLDRKNFNPDSKHFFHNPIILINNKCLPVLLTSTLFPSKLPP